MPVETFAVRVGQLLVEVAERLADERLALAPGQRVDGLLVVCTTAECALDLGLTPCLCRRCGVVERLAL
jgi:hypothetical protein